jgi:hypothetical protein
MSSTTVFLDKYASPTGNTTLDILAADGSNFPTGSSLGTSNGVANSSFNTAPTPTLVAFSWSSPVSLSASSKYCFVFHSSAAPSGTNFMGIFGSASASGSEAGVANKSASLSSGYSTYGTGYLYATIEVTPAAAVQAKRSQFVFFW